MVSSFSKPQAGQPMVASRIRAGRLDNTLAPQFALKSVEGGEDQTRQFGVLSEEGAGDGHHVTTGIGAHASNHQRDPEEGERCELAHAAAEDGRLRGAGNVQRHEVSTRYAERTHTPRITAPATT